MYSVFRNLAIIILSAKFFGLVARKCKAPQVVGEIIAGLIIGVIASLLVFFGHPANMGFCIACFLRDISGAVGLHSAAKVQYVRPVSIGLVLGAFIMSVASKEFKARAGSPPALPKSRVIKWSMPPKARTSG